MFLQHPKELQINFFLIIKGSNNAFNAYNNLRFLSSSFSAHSGQSPFTT